MIAKAEELGEHIEACVRGRLVRAHFDHAYRPQAERVESSDDTAVRKQDKRRSERSSQNHGKEMYTMLSGYSTGATLVDLAALLPGLFLGSDK